MVLIICTIFAIVVFCINGVNSANRHADSHNRALQRGNLSYYYNSDVTNKNVFMRVDGKKIKMFRIWLVDGTYWDAFVNMEFKMSNPNYFYAWATSKPVTIPTIEDTTYGRKAFNGKHQDKHEEELQQWLAYLPALLEENKEKAHLMDVSCLYYC